MKAKILATAVVTALLLAAGLFLANAQAPEKATPDPRIDKLLEQNEKILKNQEEMFKTLSEFRESLLQLRRRSN